MDGLISTGWPAITFAHSEECTFARGAPAETNVVTGARSPSLYFGDGSDFFSPSVPKKSMLLE